MKIKLTSEESGTEHVTEGVTFHECAIALLQELVARYGTFDSSIYHGLAALADGDLKYREYDFSTCRYTIALIEDEPTERKDKTWTETPLPK